MNATDLNDRHKRQQRNTFSEPFVHVMCMPVSTSIFLRQGSNLQMKVATAYTLIKQFSAEGFEHTTVVDSSPPPKILCLVYLMEQLL
jgi:hypothetical protein